MGAISLGAARRNGVGGSGSPGNKRFVEVDITFSASYSTGGDTVSLAALGLKNVTDLVTCAGNDVNGQALPASAFTGVQVQLGGTSGAPTVKLYNGSASEATAASNNSTKTVRVRFFGNA